MDVALHWTANRPGSQRIIWRANGGLFQTTSHFRRAADGDPPRSDRSRCDYANRSLQTEFCNKCAWFLNRRGILPLLGLGSKTSLYRYGSSTTAALLTASLDRWFPLSALH